MPLYFRAYLIDSVICTSGPSLQLLNEELRLAMALAGVASLAEINRSLVAHETSYFSKL